MQRRIELLLALLMEKLDRMSLQSQATTIAERTRSEA
jgi:hypothetical protein